jgi:hypothetical protein
MPRYAITERAGPFVAGIRNTGVGTVLDLTERQAEHELRLGTLVRLPEPGERVAAEARVEPPAGVAATPEPDTTPVSEQETRSAALSRKPKRSTT